MAFHLLQAGLANADNPQLAATGGGKDDAEINVVDTAKGTDAAFAIILAVIFNENGGTEVEILHDGKPKPRSR
jgi:hypothetical protein